MDVVLHIQRLKGYTLLGLRLEDSCEGITLDMLDPHRLPVDIPFFLAFKLEVRMQHEFRLEVEADIGAKLILLLSLSHRNKTQFSAIEFCGKVDVLIELDLGRYFGLVLKARRDPPAARLIR